MIHVENLTKYYHDFCAVDQISFDIPKGEIVGLLGPNGAGKTTTLRMLTGFLQPTDGSVKVKDLELEKRLIDIKKMLGYLPESAPLYHDMLVYDYLNYIADIRSVAKAGKLSRIRELGDLCAINEVMHKPIAELSKGYKQRVGLAHAMMDDPEILVLDEPTSGLDPNQIAEIRKIIRRIGKEKTIILSTHILSEAEATCDRVVIINQGRIVADGSTESLQASFGQQRLVHLTLENADSDAVRKSFGELDTIGAIDVSTDTPGRLRVKLNPAGGEDIRPQIYRLVKSTDWVLLDFHQESQTLETIFRQLTKEA
jgi:ABC-2 type transport system ATP-binding protein